MEARDIYWARYLQKKILLDDASAIVVITTFMKLVQDVFSNSYKPDAVLTFTLRDEYSVSWITALKLYSGAKILAYENEGVMNFDDIEVINKRIGNTPRSLNLVDEYFYWGIKPATISSKVLLEKKYIKSKEQVLYCGYLNYEMTSDDVKDVLSIQERTALEHITHAAKDKNVYLVLTAFAMCEYPDSLFIADGEILSDNRDEVHAYAESVRSNLKQYRTKYIKYVKRLAEDANNAFIIIKPHPSEYEEEKYIEYYKKEFQDYDNVVIVEKALLVTSLLSISKAVVHYGSTVAIEAYLRGIPTILVYDKNHKGNSEVMQSTIASSEEDTMEKIDNIKYSRNEKNDLLLEELFNFKKGIKYDPSSIIIQHLKVNEKRFLLENKTFRNFSINRNIIRWILYYIMKLELKRAINLSKMLFSINF